MKVLLVTSAAPKLSPFSTLEKTPPIGLGLLISTLKNAGHNVFFIDNYLKPSLFLEKDFLTKNSVDIFGISANTICYRDTLRMLYKAQELRDRKKWKGKIMVGGPHASVAVDTIPDFVDHIVQGEGEKAVLDAVEDRTHTRVIKRERTRDLDGLPRPAWEYFVKQPYPFRAKWLSEKPVFTLNTSRGCSFSCSFCSVKSIWGTSYRCMSSEKITEEINYLIKTYGARGIYFREDSFTLNKQRVIDLCEKLLKRNIKIKWICETRVDSLDRELINLMYRAGCRAYYIGVESGNQRILDLVKKGVTVEQAKYVFSLCNKIGMKTYASFIVGIPTEKEEEIIKTIYFSEKIKPTTRGINIFVGIPKSELYDYALSNQLYEYKDDIGLLYMKGHDELVGQIHGGNSSEKIPLKGKLNRDQFYDFAASSSTIKNNKVLAAFHRCCAENSIRQANRYKAREQSLMVMKYEPLSLRTWIFWLLSFANLKRLKGIYKKYLKNKISI